MHDDRDHVLTHTQGRWDDLRGQRLFITGGTGFFGCWLLESFIWANDTLGLNAEAVVLTRNPDAFRRKAPHLTEHPAIRIGEQMAETLWLHPAMRATASPQRHSRLCVPLPVER